MLLLDGHAVFEARRHHSHWSNLLPSSYRFLQRQQTTAVEPKPTKIAIAQMKTSTITSPLCCHLPGPFIDGT
jgi:hypothetical protein